MQIHTDTRTQPLQHVIDKSLTNHFYTLSQHTISIHHLDTLAITLPLYILLSTHPIAHPLNTRSHSTLPLNHLPLSTFPLSALSFRVDDVLLGHFGCEEEPLITVVHQSRSYHKRLVIQLNPSHRCTPI